MKNRHFPKYMSFILTCSLLMLLCFNLVFAQSPDDFITITPENADQLELGYVLPGFCGTIDPIQNLTALWKVGVYDLLTGQKLIKITSDYGDFSPQGNYFAGPTDGVVSTHTGEQIVQNHGFFSPDEQYFAAREDGVYELASRKRLFAINATGWFSPDSKLVAVEGDAIYETRTGKRLIDLPNGIVVFSPNSKYFAIWEHGVYDASTGKQIIKSSGAIPEFSPDSQYVSIYEDGVYNLQSLQKLITLPSRTTSSFSLDSSFIAITNDGIYNLTTGKRQFKISGNKYSTPHFFGKSNWLGVDDDGVYDLTSNKKRFTVKGYLFSATQDGSLVTVSQVGIYETSTGLLQFRLRDASFADHDKLVLSILNTLDAPDSMFCAVYGIKGDKWPYRSGLVDTSYTQVYVKPDGDQQLDSQGKPLFSSNQLAVFAQTPDKKWFKVSASSWVRASDVKPVSLPDGIPIENP